VKNFKIMAGVTGLIVSICFSGCNLGSVTGAKNPVDEIVDLCAQSDYNEASKHMIYHGSDKSRGPKDAANYATDDPESKKSVEQACNQLKAIKTAKHSVGPERSEQGLSVFDVTLEENGKSTKRVWAFVKINGKYALTDID
jgi:hypothetical protein